MLQDHDLTLRDLVEWETFWSLEPEVGDKAEWLAAQILMLIDVKIDALIDTVVAAATGKKRSRSERRELDSYRMRFGDDRPVIRRTQSAEQQWAILTAWAQSHQKPEPVVPVRDRRKAAATPAARKKQPLKERRGRR